MTGDRGFGNEIKQALESLLAREQARFPAAELLRIDLHCHDRNSDVTDERLGRMLRIPETWLPTADLLKTLRIPDLLELEDVFRRGWYDRIVVSTELVMGLERTLPACSAFLTPGTLEACAPRKTHKNPLQKSKGFSG